MYLFVPAEAKQTLRLARANEILSELLAPPQTDMGDLILPEITTDNLVESGGDNLVGTADDTMFDENGNEICFDEDGNEFV